MLCAAMLTGIFQAMVASSERIAGGLPLAVDHFGHKLSIHAYAFCFRNESRSRDARRGILSRAIVHPV